MNTDGVLSTIWHCFLIVLIYFLNVLISRTMYWSICRWNYMMFGFYFKIIQERGTWVVQSVKRPTSAQVTISWFMRLSPTSGCVLTARSLEPASDSVSPSLPIPCFLSLSLLQKQTLKIKKKKQIIKLKVIKLKNYWKYILYKAVFQWLLERSL